MFDGVASNTGRESRQLAKVGTSRKILHPPGSSAASDVKPVPVTPP